MGNCCKKKNNDLIETFLDSKDDNPFGIQIKVSDFQKLRLLGKGSFGEVYLVKLKKIIKYMQ